MYTLIRIVFRRKYCINVYTKRRVALSNVILERCSNDIGKKPFDTESDKREMFQLKENAISSADEIAGTSELFSSANCSKEITVRYTLKSKKCNH